MIKSFTYRALEERLQDAEIWKLETVEFDSLNLLVGPSAVGKTRILRALLEVRQAALHGLDGVSSGCWELELELDGRILSWGAGARTYVNGYSRSSDQYEYFFEELAIDGTKLVERDQQSFLYQGKPLPQLDYSRSCIELLSSEGDLQPFLGALRPWRLHAGGPGGSSERFISVQAADSAVKRFNSNIEALRADVELDPFLKLLVLQRFHSALFKSIVQDFREIFTTVEEVRLGLVDEFELVQSLGEAFEGNQVAVGIREAGIPSWILHPQFSAGMAKTLELLIETRLSPPGGVLMIDELENSLGVNCLPAVQRMLIDGSSQALLTSHHPKVINRIPLKNWKLVTRRGSTVKVIDAADIPALQTASPLEKFTQLLNTREYEEAIG